jgi:beta-lactamase class A
LRTRTGIGWLGIFSALCLLAAIILSSVELFFYSRLYPTLPPGLSLAEVPVGGLSEQAARIQLETAYNSPIELRYQNDVILLDPAEVGFALHTDIMIPEATQFRSSGNFWGGFWDYIWLRPRQFNNIPLRADFSSEKLHAYLADLATRYDRPGSLPKADVSQLGFVPGELGHTLDVKAAYDLVDAALHNSKPEQRAVTLPVIEQTAIRPTLDTLADLVRQDVRQFQFDGTFSLYLYDLQTGQEMAVNLSNSADVPGPIAFSAMSTIKIAIMTAFFEQKEGALTPDEQLILGRSIDESQNTATDQLMAIIGQGDGLEGTRQVVTVMQRLGLANTYISGLLDVAGAVLAPLGTPANSRTDLTTQPDPYNQTTAEDMGALLTMIYQCSQGGGTFMAAFPGQFTPDECRQMIDLLTNNSVGPIFIAGGSLPNGVVAHKHGWDRLPLTNVADAAMVFTPGGQYVFTIYLNQPATMEFDPANRLIISVAKAVYAYFNPGSKAGNK